MRRRAFLGTVGGTTAVALSGCLEGGMDFEIAELSSPTPVVEDVGSEEDSYTAMVENQGREGLIRVELYYQEDESSPNPEQPSLYGGGENPDVSFDSAEVFEFDAEQRREVSVTAEGSTDRNLFRLLGHPASYTGVIDNSGDGGEVEARFEMTDAGGYEVDTPEPKTLELESDARREVTFEVVLPLEATYRVVVEEL